MRRAAGAPPNAHIAAGRPPAFGLTRPRALVDSRCCWRLTGCATAIPPSTRGPTSTRRLHRTRRLDSSAGELRRGLRL